MSSEKYGWLVPVPPAELKSVEDALGKMVCALCGISPELVRPRYQPLPKAAPGHKVDWCAFGVVSENAAGGSVWHEDGHSRLMVHQEMEVLFSFYGPHAREKARALRDGLWVEQNRAVLRLENNIALLRMGAFQDAPEYDGNRWLMRRDLSITFVRGPEVSPKPGHEKDVEGYLDIEDIKTAKPCGLCQRSR